MKKLTPRNLQVGTYTTDSVKIVGSCKFHLVHLDTKKLLETTFSVAMNDGSVLLSCKTTLQLGLIQPRARLDYLLPRASLITSSADHRKKTKEVLHIQRKQVAAQRKVPGKSTLLPAVKEKGLKLITSKEMISGNTLMSSKGLASSQGQITIYKLIQSYHPNKHLADQSLSI